LCWSTIIATTKDIILGVAGITGAIVAIVGVNTWRRQLKGQVEYDLARRLLRLTFQYRDAIDRVRNPFIYSYEMPEPPLDQAAHMNRDQIEFYGLSKAYKKRWDGVVETRNALYPDLLEAEALWGRELGQHFSVLFGLETELSQYISYYLRLRNPDAPRHDKEAIAEIHKGKRDVMYGVLGTNDEYKKDFSEGIKQIETYLKTHLQR
jgi:hypothetical protein